MDELVAGYKNWDVRMCYTVCNKEFFYHAGRVDRYTLRRIITLIILERTM